MKNWLGKNVPDSVLWVIFGLMIAGAAYGAYAYTRLYHQSVSLEQSLAETEQSLQQEQTARRDLAAKLNAAMDQNSQFSGQISNIASTVGQLEKLKSLDPELLRKYSKIYFLSENYFPANLTDIPAKYLYHPKTPEQILAPVLPFLTRMFDAATSSGVELDVLSAYRSFPTQATLKESYEVTYGYGANSFSADQGYSEHQLGTALDIATASTTAATIAFAKTGAYPWLKANAYKYGFIMSYPPDNTFYQFEPWHWRFVGVELATKLHNDGTEFYNLDQRTLDTYLIKIFD